MHFICVEFLVFKKPKNANKNYFRSDYRKVEHGFFCGGKRKIRKTFIKRERERGGGGIQFSP